MYAVIRSSSKLEDDAFTNFTGVAKMSLSLRSKASRISGTRLKIRRPIPVTLVIAARTPIPHKRLVR